MKIYVPSVEFDDDGVLKYRSVIEYEDAWLHVVYVPKYRKMDLIAHPKLGMRDFVDYESELLDEYHNYEEESQVSWWRFRVGGHVLQVNLLGDEVVGSEDSGICLHVDGVAFLVSLKPVEAGE